MDDIFHEYTAGELLEWMKNRPIDEYLDANIVEINGESVATTIIDIEKIKLDFYHHVKRYVVVKRGHILYIHDNKTCQDLLSWNITNDNEEYVQNTANATCDSLNNRVMRFIGKKDKCW